LEGLSVAIQAGGHSTRMGQDKALLPFLGEALVRRILKRVTPIAQEVFVVTNQPEAYTFLETTLIADIMPKKGPLGGLLTALSFAQHPFVAMIACDMPFANPDILALALNILKTTRKDVVMPRTNHKLEPLHAIYRRQTCLSPVQAILRAGRRKVIAWLPSVDIYELTWKEMETCDPDHLAFINVNNPEEFRQAEQIARFHQE
jgi:molybdopterin-guanine dinucleotide biosynthesis protein A